MNLPMNARLKLSWLLALVLLCSNALVAWHSGAHYFEYQNRNYDDQTSTLHSTLCSVGVLAQASLGATATPWALPNLGKASFWLPASFYVDFHSQDRLPTQARAPPAFFS